MKNLNNLLAGNDLRSLGNSSDIILIINDQESFDKLFEYGSRPSSFKYFSNKFQ